MGVLAKSPFGETPFRPPPTFLIAFWRTTRDLTFGVRLGDGFSWGTEDRPGFTLVVKQPEALRASSTSQ